MRRRASVSSWSGRTKRRSLTSDMAWRRLAWSLLVSPSPPDISISPLRAAAFAAAIICALLVLQYAHRRKPFILLWASGWLLIAPAMLLVARGYASETAA